MSIVDQEDYESHIEIMRNLVDEAEVWSELLLRYSKSLIYYFLPATILTLTVTMIAFFYIVLSWGFWSNMQQILSLFGFFILLVLAFLAIWKEADAILRHRLNKNRHSEWKYKFQRLKETEERLEDLLGSTHENNSSRLE